MEINAYTERAPIHFNVKFDDWVEAKNLLAELTQWTPHGGWSDEASTLFQELKAIVQENE